MADRRLPCLAGWAVALAALPGVAPAQDSPIQPATPTAADAASNNDAEPNRQDRVNGLDLGEPHRDGFLEGTRLDLKPRSYYLDRQRDAGASSVGWALGGALDYRSGWAWDRVQLGGTLFTSQVLYGPSDEDGTGLFAPGPEGFTVLGEAHLTVRFGNGNGMRVGRQSFDLPYLSPLDIRMVPNTFEAVAVGRPVKQGFAYIAGYVDRIKTYDSDRFVPMAEAAGAAGADRGLGMIAAQYVFDDGSVVGATWQESFDVMRTTFAKAEKSFALGAETSIRGYLQYTDQRSVDDALIGGFGTHVAAMQAELFHRNASVRLARSRTGCCGDVLAPFGGSPNYLSIIINDFDRAGEDAWMLGASYDFADAGLPGFSAFANVAVGDTPESGPFASPDQTEVDLTLDYRFRDGGRLHGLWLRVRGAYVDQDEAAGGNDFLDFRVILNVAHRFF